MANRHFSGQQVRGVNRIRHSHCFTLSRSITLILAVSEIEPSVIQNSLKKLQLLAVHNCDLRVAQTLR